MSKNYWKYPIYRVIEVKKTKKGKLKEKVLAELSYEVRKRQ